MLQKHSMDAPRNIQSGFVRANWPAAYPALSLTCHRFAHLSEAMSPATRLTPWHLIKDKTCSKAKNFGAPLMALGQLVCAGMSPQHIAQMLAAAASTWSEEFDVTERCPAQASNAINCTISVIGHLQPAGSIPATGCQARLAPATVRTQHTC